MHTHGWLFILLWISLPFSAAFASDPCGKDWVTPDATAACAEKRLSVDIKVVAAEYRKLLALLPQKLDEQSEFSPTATKTRLENAQAAWTKSVDINCALSPSISGGEFHYVSARADYCRQEEYQRRAKQLKRWRLCIEEGGSQCP